MATFPNAGQHDTFENCGPRRAVDAMKRVLMMTLMASARITRGNHPRAQLMTRFA
jgi:hypothetical protein